jgi:carboxybiotin decarboxylase
MVLLGAAGQFGIFGTLILATLLGFPSTKPLRSAQSARSTARPPSLSPKLAPELLAPIAVAAYSYMSLIPIIQPPIMRLMTTRKERLIRMDYSPRPVSRRFAIALPDRGHPGGRPAWCPDATPLIAC